MVFIFGYETGPALFGVCDIRIESGVDRILSGMKRLGSIRIRVYFGCALVGSNRVWVTVLGRETGRAKTDPGQFRVRINRVGRGSIEFLCYVGHQNLFAPGRI